MHLSLSLSSGIRGRLSRRFLTSFFAIFIIAAVSSFLFKAVFAAPTEPIPSIDFTSQQSDYSNNEAGAWKINKMAGWTARNKARIVIDVDTELHYKDKNSDILLVVDRSSSVDGENKTTNYHEALKSFTNDIFDDDDDRQMALVTFDYDYHIKSYFTSDREQILSEIDDIYFDNIGNNYYQALNGADKVLRSYTKRPDRDVILIFLTDGAPDEESYYQRAEYLLIKHRYPYLTINAIQYEINDNGSHSVSSISDAQYLADRSTLRNILFEASVFPYDYDEFVLTDYISTEYFELADTNTVLANKGSYRIEYDGDTPKIIWDLSGALRAGTSATMEINLNLKDEYTSAPLLFPTNSRTTVVSSIPEKPDENVATEASPVLKAHYKVIYQSNLPSDCDPVSVPQEKTQFIFDVVEVESDVLPVCPGYKFSGYKPKDRLKKINDDYFIMPSNDVTLVANWAKVGISKSMDGEVHVVKTLYGEIDKKTKLSDGTYNLDSSFSYTYGSSAYYANGAYIIASTAEDEFPIHYFRGTVDDNNVLFAGQCWKAFRTTATGGVKLIYNGEVDANGQCGDDRDNHDGLGRVSSYGFGSSNYYYGTDYTYDKTTRKFKLAGIRTLARMDSNNIDSLIGQYTCRSSNENMECSNLYYLLARYKDSSTVAYVSAMNADTPFYSIGKTVFNTSDDSMAHVGYMYGDVYDSTQVSYNGARSHSDEVIISNTNISADFWYADDITYNADGNHRYYLINPYQVESSSDFQGLVGKYTFRSNSAEYNNDSVYYIAAVSGSTMYYLHLKSGDALENVDVSYQISEDVIDNGDGTYTMIDPITIKTSDWPTRYSTFNNHFICGWGGVNEDGTCSDLRYITQANINTYQYVGDERITIAKARDGYNLQNYVTVRRYQLSQNFGSYDDYVYSCGSADTVCTPENLIMITKYSKDGFEYITNILISEDAVWDGEQYILSGQSNIENVGNLDVIATHHYFCETPGQTVCRSVRYINSTRRYSNYSYTTIYAITLSGGTTPSQAVDKMFENKYDSTAKQVLDNWYARTLLDHSGLIEDTPYCNDRTIYSLGGWNPNGGRTDTYTYFDAYMRGYSGSRYEIILDCSTRDAFTVDAANGNGALTYPVGLISNDEVNLVGDGSRGTDGTTHYLRTSEGGFIMTPHYYGSSVAYIFQFGAGYGMCSATYDHQLRPVISIIPGAIITDGDGTADHPWVVE